MSCVPWLVSVFLVFGSVGVCVVGGCLFLVGLGIAFVVHARGRGGGVPRFTPLWHTSGILKNGVPMPFDGGWHTLSHGAWASINGVPMRCKGWVSHI